MENQDNRPTDNGGTTAPSKETITITLEELQKIKDDVIKTVKEDIEAQKKASEIRKDILDAARAVKNIDPIQQESSGVSCKEFVETTLDEYEFGMKYNQEPTWCLKLGGQDNPFPDHFMKFEILCDRYIRDMKVEDIIKKVEAKYGRH